MADLEMRYPTKVVTRKGSAQQWVLCPLGEDVDSGQWGTAALHWWGQQNPGCDECVLVSTWRRRKNIVNNINTAGIGPLGEFPFVTDDEVAVTETKLLNLVRDLAGESRNPVELISW